MFAKRSGVIFGLLGSIVVMINPLSARAAPATRVEVQPSAILVFATNPEEKPYNCTITMVWSHNSFGERKANRESRTFHVVAKAKDVVVYRLAGAYVDVQIDSGPDISCT